MRKVKFLSPPPLLGLRPIGDVLHIRNTLRNDISIHFYDKDLAGFTENHKPSWVKPLRCLWLLIYVEHVNFFWNPNWNDNLLYKKAMLFFLRCIKQNDEDKIYDTLQEDINIFQ